MSRALILRLVCACFLVLSWHTSLCHAQQCRLRLAQDVLNEPPTRTTASAAPSFTLTPPVGGDIAPNSTVPSSTTGPTISGSSSASATPTPTPFNYGVTPIRGVNLGGWFVLEPWITPSIFQNTNNTGIVDEFTMGQMLDSDTVSDILENHWKTWITEDDFIAIKNAGLNHVRIQIGYWSVPITSADTNFSTSVSPYTPGAWPYFVQALNWAKAHGLHTIVDLHGAPGSQNGFDNSGQRTGNPTWGQDPNSVPRTLDIIKFIAEKVGGLIDVMELLNEPAAYRQSVANVLEGFWTQGYNVVRNTAGGAMKVMIGDGFLGVQSWENFLTYPNAQGVFMDFHEYQIFNFDQLELSWDAHINYSCSVKDMLTSYAQSNLFTIIGEWTTAPTDCAMWLNGRGVGARWDGTWQPGQQTFGSCQGMTGSMATFSNDYKTFLRKYWEAQVTIGEAIQGWVYWTWKAENADDWSYQKGLEGGWIPQDPDDRLYPNLCS
ncbi:glycoside hydrolase family 5 protein [Panus rudis PR-1116 ss-1]|nr:glycoside hydrolase family 5 protein [Panus rudis PR-1116 ss-1]